MNQRPGGASPRAPQPRAPQPRPGSGLPGAAAGIVLATSPAALLSVIGLAIVALLTLGLFTGQLPFLPSRSGGSGVAGGGPNLTPAPSNVVVIDPRSDVPGSLVYV